MATNNQCFLKLETPYGLLLAWVDVAINPLGEVVGLDVDIQRFTPSAKMRHKIITEYRRTERKTPRGRGVARYGEVLEFNQFTEVTE